MKKLFLLLLFLQITLFASEKNSVIVTEHSLETLQWMHTLIDKAESSIELSTFSTGGKVLMDIFLAIEKRLEKAPFLKVSMLASPLLLEEMENQRIESLQKKFPGRFQLERTAAFFTLDSDYCIKENHIKLLVVDEKYFIVGGTNLHEMMCCRGDKENADGVLFLAEGTRDMDVVCRGPTASLLRQLFYQLFAFWKKQNVTYLFEWADLHSEYFPIVAKASIEAFEKSASRVDVEAINVIFGNPCEYPNAITLKYEELVAKAAKDIFIANFYFNPPSSLFEKLEQKANNKLKINIITNGLWERSPAYSSLICWANRINYAPLFDVASHLGIFEYQVPGILYHKKVMVIDHSKTLIGSYNLNVKSDRCDFELALVIDSEKVANNVIAVLEKDKKLSIEVNKVQAEKWASDPILSYKAALQKLFQGFL